MTARRVLAALLLVLAAGCEPQSDYRVPDSGAPAVWVTPSTYPAPGPCGGGPVTAPNAALAYQVLDLARASGDSFEMSSWAWSLDGEPVGLDDLTKHDCGTTACLAGWTAAVMGYKVDSAACVFDSDGNEVSGELDLFAAGILGIDADQAGRLFYSSDSQVGRLVAEIFGPRPDGGEGGNVTDGGAS